MGFILYIIATFLWLPITLINVVFVVYNYRKKHGFFKVLNNYFKQTAIGIDRFANHNFRSILNATCIEPDGYKFGNFKETISSVLGKNQGRKKLKGLGIFIAFMLDSIDKNHCKKSINLDV